MSKIPAFAPLLLGSLLIGSVNAQEGNASPDMTYVLPVEISRMPRDVTEFAVGCATLIRDPAGRQGSPAILNVESDWTPLDADGAYSGTFRLTSNLSDESRARGYSLSGGGFPNCNLLFRTADGRRCSPSNDAADNPCRAVEGSPLSAGIRVGG